MRRVLPFLIANLLTNQIISDNYLFILFLAPPLIAFHGQHPPSHTLPPTSSSSPANLGVEELYIRCLGSDDELGFVGTYKNYAVAYFK